MTTRAERARVEATRAGNAGGAADKRKMLDSDGPQVCLSIARALAACGGAPVDAMPSRCLAWRRRSTPVPSPCPAWIPPFDARPTPKPNPNPVSCHRRRMTPDRPRVLLLWPGGVLGGGRNFGVPQLLMLAGAVRRASDAVVDVVDLDLERAFGPVDLRALLAKGYDLIGISCYSSFDYLKVMAIAEQVKQLAPRAWLVTGGYHPSARPDDFTGQDSPFDFVIVGDGERPLSRLAQALVSGKRPLNRVLGPESVADIRELAPYDWSLLERYRPIARRVASQAEIYLSRGCPYDCAFCMERAKRDVSWRALEAEQAVEEMHRLDAFLDLRSWTLFVADALFGMKKNWRREFLEALARRPVRARRVWLLIRVDLIEREDLELMARANVSPGFGLESGDPEHLKRIRKAGKLDDYLEKMLVVSEWARQLDVPFGANIIVGHPGETEQTLRTTARYMKRLFLESSCGHPRFSVGRSVSPLPRLADRHRARELGKRDRVSCSALPLVERRRPGILVRVGRSLRGPRLPHRDPLAPRAARSGGSRHQAVVCLARAGARLLHARRRRTGRAGVAQAAFAHARPLSAVAGAFDRRLGCAEQRAATVADLELCDVARAARRATLEARTFRCSPLVHEALIAVPRERFVPVEYVAQSALDRALPLDDHGRSTISALHAYAEAFDALELGPGDDFTELGAGTGYGAALAAKVVGSAGTVRALELDPDLAELARQNLETEPKVTILTADAHDVELWRGARKVSCAFADRAGAGRLARSARRRRRAGCYPSAPEPSRL